MQYIIGRSIELIGAVRSAEQPMIEQVSAQDFEVAFLIMPIGLIIALLLCIFLRESFPTKRHHGS